MPTSLEELDLDDVSCLKSAVGFNDVEFDESAFFDGFEAFHFQLGIVEEYILVVSQLDESKTLFLVKFFNLALHFY